MVNTIYLFSFVETPRKFFIAELSIIISTDEAPSLRIESSAIINLRGVSTKLNKYIYSCLICIFLLYPRIPLSLNGLAHRV